MKKHISKISLRDKKTGSIAYWISGGKAIHSTTNVNAEFKDLKTRKRWNWEATHHAFDNSIILKEWYK